MEWANIIGGLIAALMFAIGLPLALKKRKQTAPQKMGELFEHLQKMGVEASLVENDAARGKDRNEAGFGTEV